MRRLNALKRCRVPALRTLTRPTERAVGEFTVQPREVLVLQPVVGAFRPYDTRGIGRQGLGPGLEMRQGLLESQRQQMRVPLAGPPDKRLSQRLDRRLELAELEAARREEQPRCARLVALAENPMAQIDSVPIPSRLETNDSEVEQQAGISWLLVRRLGISCSSF